MKKILYRFLNWLYYLNYKTKKQRKREYDIEMAVWQFDVFTR